MVVIGGILALPWYGAESAGPNVKGLIGGAVEPTGRIEAKADKLDYDRAAGKIEATGNVVITKGGDELRADHVRVNLQTEEADAFGHVVLKRATGTWTGERVHYNFRTKEGDCDQFALDVAPYHIVGGKGQRMTSTNTYAINDAAVTTCSNGLADAHWSASVRDMEVVPGQYFNAHGAVVYLGAVPVMYLPYWYRNLREDVGFRFLPGYDSRMGAFLLTSTRYRLNPYLRASTELDYRTERGLGGGETLKWNDPEGEWFGDVTGYYASDSNPWDKNDDPLSSGISSDRYRFRLRNTDNLTDRDSLVLQANYLSDTDILEDFFEDEYREGIQPENYLVYTHRQDTYTVNAQARGRLNTFYSSVERLPEVSIDFMRQPIEGTMLYYEGRTAMASLQKVWAEAESGAADYSALRFDSAHTVSYPERYFGFLNISPRVGYRGTYYSKTRSTQTTVGNTVTSATNTVVDGFGNTNVTITTTSGASTNTTDVEAGAMLRSRVELGVEVSYKAFATWDADGTPMRHIIEPYANYTFVPEPNLLPEDIYQFDEVDRLRKDHSVKIGARNKLQTKRNNEPFDLMDIDAYARFLLEPEEGENVLDSVNVLGELHLIEGLKIKFDAEANPDDGLRVLNTRVEAANPKLWVGGVEYRFRKDDSSLLLADLTLFPKARWTCNAYGRYEMEDSQLEEAGGYLQRNYDCISVRTGVGFIPAYTRTDGIVIEDEWRVILGLWLTAFPEGGLIGRYKK